MIDKKLFQKKLLMELDEDINDSEYNVLNDLIDKIDIIQKYSIREAAKNNFISTASISRLCYKFGLSGYSEFKFYLKAEYDEFVKKSDNNKVTLKNKLNSIVNVFEYNYKKTVDNIAEEELNRFLELLCENKGILVCGNGLSEVMGIYFSQKFQLAGKKVDFINLSMPREIYINHLKESSAMVIFSKSGELEAFNNKIQLAKKNNLKVVLITSKKKNEEDNRADVILEIYCNNKSLVKDDEISSYNSNVIIIVDILVELYIQRNKNKH